jgi:hypothetical protein
MITIELKKKKPIEVEFKGVVIEAQPTVEPLVATENGVYRSDYDGYQPVTVEVPLPSGTKQITENGTHDVYDYAEANVNVQPTLQDKIITENGSYTAGEGYDGLGEVTVDVADTIDTLIDGSISEISSDVDRLRSYAFAGAQSLTSAELPNVTTAGERCFQSAPKLQTLRLPKIKSISSYFAAYCGALESVDLTSVEVIGVYALAISFNGQLNYLKTIRLPVIRKIDTMAFQYRSKLEAIILGADTRATLASLIAIPAETIVYAYQKDIDAWYSTATNWSALYEQDRILPIEGSDYE